MTDRVHLGPAQAVIRMTGYDTNDGYRIAPLDDRDADDPDYRIDPRLSSTNTDFGGEDPAVDHPDPRPELAPAWNRAEGEGEEV